MFRKKRQRIRSRWTGVSAFYLWCHRKGRVRVWPDWLGDEGVGPSCNVISWLTACTLSPLTLVLSLNSSVALLPSRLGWAWMCITDSEKWPVWNIILHFTHKRRRWMVGVEGGRDVGVRHFREVLKVLWSWKEQFHQVKKTTQTLQFQLTVIWCWLGLKAVTHSQCTSYGGWGQQHGSHPVSVEIAAGAQNKIHWFAQGQSPPWNGFYKFQWIRVGLHFWKERVECIDFLWISSWFNE